MRHGEMDEDNTAIRPVHTQRRRKSERNKVCMHK